MTKVVIIGAGSASFGLETLSALMNSAKLRGSHLALVDRNPDALDLMARLAARLNREWDAQMRVTAHAGHLDALPGADFVVSAIEVPPRERLWQQDWEIPSMACATARRTAGRALLRRATSSRC